MDEAPAAAATTVTTMLELKQLAGSKLKILCPLTGTREREPAQLGRLIVPLQARVQPVASFHLVLVVGNLNKLATGQCEGT